MYFVFELNCICFNCERKKREDEIGNVCQGVDGTCPYFRTCNEVKVPGNCQGHRAIVCCEMSPVRLNEIGLFCV